MSESAPRAQSAARPMGFKSMTGFAEARMERDGWSLRASLRSVNHRFLDIHLRLPEGLESLETEIRRVLRDRLHRGHVDVNLRVDPVGTSAVQINRELAEAYLQSADNLRQQFGLQGEPDLIALMRLPGVVAAPGTPAGGMTEESSAKLAAMAAECVAQAVARLEEMQFVEGRALAEVMRRHLARVDENAAKIVELAERSRPAYAKRLEARLRDLLGESAMDPARLAQEAAMLAERSDVSEELARLASHVEQFGKLLGGTGEMGKKLDFLLQEMQREANTLLSKTPGVEEEGLQITSLALEIKSEIEKLREQGQNIE
ncbi:MAG TPA: YicC/YloC family endoribonuclease [Candidatus Limnocylindrales bacterium]|nr:YicC/YloC family endoribonuclease [Candidatus Limnocylindrales bacterium]